MEKVWNQGTPGFYSRLFLVPIKNGKLFPVIELSLLNLYINKQHFKMETVKSVSQRLGCLHRSDGCISSCYDTSEIQKIHQFVYEHQVFQFTALSFGMYPKSVDFHKINECNSSTLTTTCRIALPIPRQLANRSDSQYRLIFYIHSSNGTNLPNLRSQI